MCMECTIEDCNKKVRAKGLCGMHYERVRKHGDPHHSRTYSPEGLASRRKSLEEVRAKSSSYLKKDQRVTLLCKHCKQPFNVIPFRSKGNYKRTYCSEICSRASHVGKVLSQEQKDAISAAQRKRFKENPESNPFYGRTPTNYNGWGHGQFVEELGYWVRSTWERDYLVALKQAGILFEYESERFDLGNGNGTYCPDLRLDGQRIYIEITGWDKPSKVRKRQLFREKYTYPLYVWDKKPTVAHIAEFVAMCKVVISNIEC